MTTFQITRLPDELIPAYRERQTTRLLRNLRVSLPAGAFISLGFIPWTRMHDQTGQLPTTELGLLLSLGFFSIFLLTYVTPVKRHLEPVTLTAYVFCLTIASIILAVLPGGFLYGVGTFLSFTVFASVLAVDLSMVVRAVMAGSFLLIPNAALVITDAPGLTFMNTNWILVSGGVIAFGLAFLMDQANRNTFLLEYRLALEKERGDALLGALLPRKITERLQETDDVIAEIKPDVTVLFADLVGFTELTRSLTPQDLINLLSNVFTTLDELTRDHGLEKIKTIGDSYMVAAGVADAEQKTSADVAEFALEAIDAVSYFVTSTGARLDLRVGMSTGPVVGGVIGRRKPYFDLWGTTVNLASRLQDTAPPGTVQVDAGTARSLEDRYHFTKQGQITLRGIGNVETCLLTARMQSVTINTPNPRSPQAAVTPADT